MRQRQLNVTVKLIVLALFFSIIGWAVYSGSAVRSVDHVVSGWQQQGSELKKLHVALHKTYETLGYDGPFYNFKSYLLQRDETYITEFDASIDEFRQVLLLYDKLNLGDTEQAALVMLGQTIDQYQGMFDAVVDAQHAGTLIDDLNYQPSIENEQTLFALAVLDKMIEERTEKAQEQALQALAKSRRLIKQSWILIPILILIMGIAYMSILRLGRMMAELHSAHQELDSILNASPDAIIVMDDSGQIVLANAEMVHLFGYSKDELMLPGFDGLFPKHFSEGNSPLHSGFFSGLKSTKKTERKAIYVSSKKGEEIITDINVGFFERDGQTLTVASLRDIRKRFNDDRSLQQSEERFRHLFDNASDGVMIVGLDGRVLEVNGRMVARLGYSRYEIIGSEPGLFCCQESSEKYSQHLDEIKKFGRILFESIILTKSGESIPAEINSCLINYNDSPAILNSIRDISERKKVQKKLQQSEQRFRALFEDAPVGAIVLNVDGEFLLVNRALEKMLSYDFGELKGMKFTDITFPSDINKDLELFNEMIAGKCDRYNFQKRYLRKDGEMVWGSLSVSAVRDFNGEITNVIGMIEDITELKNSEQEMLAAEEKYRTLFEMSPDGILVVDEKTMRPTSFNKSAHEQLGYSREEFKKIAVQDYEAIGNSKETQRYIYDVAARGRNEFETLHRRKDGELRNVFVSTQQVKIDGIPSFYTIFRDLTEVRQMSERLQLATRVGKIGVWDWNIETDKVNWDENMTLLYQLPVEECSDLNQVWRDRLHTDDRVRVLSALEQALNDGGDFDEEFRIRLPSGDVRYLRTVAAIFRDEGGQSLRLTGVNWDITELKQTEHALSQEKHNAEQANRAKSDFLANMSHEIRTPLNAIIGLTQLILGTELNAIQSDYLTKVQGSSKSLLSILNDILDYSKIEAGHLELEKASFSLEELLEQLASLFSVSLEEKCIELYYWVKPDVPRWLVGDALRLSQVLINLVSNALKFTQFGEVQLHISVVETEPKLCLRFSVMDTGIGISLDERQRLFSAFSQADTSITRRYGGTGLGLAISQNLVGMMGGEIIVDSTPGQGSTFSFNALFDKSSEPESVVGWSDKNLRVLLLSGHSLTRNSLREMLESWNFDVHTAESGQMGFESCKKLADRSRYFDFIVFDAEQKDMMGWEFIKLIDEAGCHSSERKLPKLILLAAISSVEEKRLHEPNIDAVLKHPITSSTMYDTMVNLCQKKTTSAILDQSLKKDFRELGKKLWGTKVLLVEDNEINRQVASTLLSQAGLTVSVAHNGREAVERIKQADFDVILMDLQMPEMDGLCATQVIRKFNSDIPIIAMTAAAMQEDRQRCLDAGMNDHIAKPIEPLTLIQTLLRWVKVPDFVAEKDTQKRFSFTDKFPELFDLPGIDAKKGLGLVVGNYELYIHLLKQFYNQFSESADSVLDMYVGSQREALTHLLHTLKGVAGSIGALDLQHYSQELEKVLLSNHSISKQNCIKLSDLLRQVLTSIETLNIKDDKLQIESVAVDYTLALERLGHVESLLADNELVTKEELDILFLSLDTCEASGSINKLHTAILDFDYGKAVKLAGDVRNILEGHADE